MRSSISRRQHRWLAISTSGESIRCGGQESNARALGYCGKHVAPKSYEGVKSAVPPEHQTIAAGSKLYGEHCAVCHGQDGMGDGEPGRAVSPSPALLAYMIRRRISVDEYLLWTISDGGKQFDSEMPAFKDKLSRDDIWRVIAYMRAGFPDASGGSSP